MKEIQMRVVSIPVEEGIGSIPREVRKVEFLRYGKEYLIRYTLRDGTVSHIPLGYYKTVALELKEVDVPEFLEEDELEEMQ